MPGKPTYKDLRRRIEELEKESAMCKRTERVLLENQGVLNAVFNAVDTGILLIDPSNHTIVKANPMAASLCGTTPQEMEGRICHQFVCPALEGKCPVTDLGQKVDRSERVLLAGNGKEIPILKTVVSVTIDSRPYLLESFLDITDRKQTEDAFRESIETMKSIFRAAPVGIGMVIDRVIVEANAQLSQMTGYSMEEMLGESARMLYPTQEEYERVGSVKYAQIDLRGTGSIETRWLRKDGEVIDILLSSSAIDPSNLSAGVTFTALDITQRKQAEGELKRLQAQYASAMEMARLGHWEYDVANDLFTFNDQFYKIFRTSAEQVGGYTLPSAEYARRFVHPDDIPLVGEEIRKAMETTDPNFSRTLEHRILYDDGTIGYISVRFFVVKDAQGRTIKTYGVNQDITDRKLAEEEKEKLLAQLLQAQKMESVGRLAGGVAHDFNNMLGIIIGNAEMAALQIDSDEPLHQNLQEIIKASHRSADTVRQLLAFARKQTVSPKILNLNETVSGMLKMLRRLIGEDIELVWVPGEALGRVRMDPTQVNQILANLAVNSRDAMPIGGKIIIETVNKGFDEEYCREHDECTPGEYVLLAVSDTGTGMSPEIMEHLFDPFFTTKEVGRGTGLGLATVYGVVKQNNGFVNVYSEPGRGTIFRIYFPRYEGTTTVVREKAEGKLPRGTETILIAEDEAPLLNIARDILTKQGYTVLAARTPTEALSLSGKHHGEIHLLLTDVVMPEMNGRQLAERLMSGHPGLKCLFMSGYTANVVAHHGVLNEGVHFIEKPFSPRAMAEKIREVLDSQEPE